VSELAGDAARHAASTADVVVGANRATGAGVIGKAWKPPAARRSGVVRIAGSAPGVPGAANGVALTGPADASVVAPGSSTAVISVVSRNGVASSTGPSAGTTGSRAVSSGGGVFTGKGGNGPPWPGVGRGIVTPAPTLTCVTEPSFPGLAIRIAILVLTW